MTMHDHSEAPEPIDGDRIARELAVLGEAPPEPSELEWIAGSSALRADGDEEVATTHALFRVAAGHARSLEALSPLEKRRVWKRLAGHIEAKHAASASAGGGGEMGRRMMAALAMAAAVVLVTRLAMVGQAPASPTVDARATAEALAAQARAGLDVLPGEVDGARARSLADAYATRLRDDRGGT